MYLVNYENLKYILVNHISNSINQSTKQFGKRYILQFKFYILDFDNMIANYNHNRAIIKRIDKTY